ncbi:MAG TPA: 3'-5' exonuclease [Candidatus Baltobacteraceae bacterium]|jgi:superfamily I DNA/RNA helicase
MIITGKPGSGKTRELLARIAAAEFPRDRLIVASPHPLSAARIGGTTLATYAFEILEQNAFVSGLALELGRIEDVDAETHFQNAAASLFSLEWLEVAEPELGGDLDYEVAGLRAPERFAQAAYRLIRKLRAAGITPKRFLETALHKATEWYAKPPNLANPDLLIAARRYRDSLNADGPELERQRRREIDLAKILEKTYLIYVADSESRGCLTDIDAMAEATRVLVSVDGAAQRARERWPLAFIDDAQDVTLGELGFLRAIYGKELTGVTFAGDPDQSTRTFAGARPEQVFTGRDVLQMPAPSEPRATIIAVAHEFLQDRNVFTEPQGTIALQRVGSHEKEATFIAAEIAKLLEAGTQPQSIAILVRTLRYARPYVDALLDDDVPVTLIGDLDVLGSRVVQDALSLLWSVVDPSRHDWLLRVLQTPTMRLSDATLVTLCGEASDAQARLFPPSEAETEGESPRVRSDRNRDVRLGQNVIEGARDIDLEPDARMLLERFRALRLRWREIVASASLEDASRLIVMEGGIFEPDPGENGARLAHRRDLLERLMARIARYARADRTRTLGDLLTYLERIAKSEWPQCDPGPVERSGVVVAQIDAVKGCAYESVFVPNLRAGAFPPYWVPDAFVYTTGSGIIPKDNVGDARASRTAKFTWYQYQGGKVLQSHAAEARRLLYCAMTRATQRCWLTAWDRPTRGISAPELLAELERIPLFRTRTC